jgi:DNA-binding beta-propeller fold protein YncE
MAQNLFASDTTHIYQFTPNGAYTRFAMSPGYITGLAVDSAGNLYYADANYGTVVKVAPDGTPTTFATGLIQPFALAFNKAGDLFVSQVPGTGAGTGSILEFLPNGARTVFATGLGAPAHMAFNSAGDLFVSDGSGVSPIYRFAPNGTRSTFATVARQGISGLAFNSAGDLFIGAGGIAGYIYEFAPDGTRTTFASGLNTPIDLAFNQTGDLFVSEFGTAPYIYRFAPDGTRAAFASAVAAQGLAFQVPEPSTLAIAATWGFLFAYRRNVRR